MTDFWSFWGHELAQTTDDFFQLGIRKLPPAARTLPLSVRLEPENLGLTELLRAKLDTADLSEPVGRLMPK